MVVKMMKWSSASKTFQVKIKPLKLQGFNPNLNGCDHELEKKKEKTEKVIVLEVKWRGSKTGLVPLRRHSLKHRRNVSTPVVMKRGNEVIQWNDEFECVCSFSIFQKDNSFNPWNVSFDLLYGQSTEPTKRLILIGAVSLNIAELASLMEPHLERQLPVSVRVAGVSSEAMLLISVSFVEIRNSQDSLEVVYNVGVTTKEDRPSKKKKKKMENAADEGEESDDSYSGGTDEPASDPEESTAANNSLSQDSKESGHGSTPCVVAATKEEPSVYYGNGSDKENSSETQMESSPSRRTWLRSVSKIRLLSWKKRRPSTVSSKEKQKTDVTSTAESSSIDNTLGSWKEKELTSRDGQAKLKANVFFASMDQRSEKAAGESACTALVTVIADWLHSNGDAMPSWSEFDNLIKEGSSEWRKLCDNEVYLQRFPDKHFDLETMLEAELRPVLIKPEKSFVGFFCPEKFESLKGTMCFDGIWDQITKKVKEAEPKVYIVSWNDHFFILKVEADAYYIIDTLGERLFEGCNQAYILKFDDRSCLYRLPENAAKEDTKDEGGERERERESESERLVCSGKECCREFIKRFFAAIPLSELEKEEEKGTASIVSLHQRLQIEFHFSSASTSPSSSSCSFPSLSSSSHSPSTSLSSSSDENDYRCV